MGDWIGSGRSHIGVYNLEGTSYSAPSFFEHRQLRYKRLQYDVFGDTLLSVTKSKGGKKYAEVFVTKFGW